MSLLKYLLTSLFIVFPLGEFVRIQVGQNAYVKPLDIISGFILVIVVYQLVRYRTYRSKLSLSLLIFPLLASLALLLNISWLHKSSFITAGLYLVRWIAYMSVFFGLVWMDKQYKKSMAITLFLAGFVITIAGYLQYFFFNSLIPWKSFGWDDHLYRLFSVFLDPNFAGAFFVLYFIFSAGLFLFVYEKEKIFRLDINKHLQLKRTNLLWGIAIIAILSLFATFLTFSRSSLIMLLTSSIIFLSLIGRKKFIGGLILIMAVFIFLISSHFNVENINLLREASSLARIANYETSLGVYIDKPLLGVGFNTYRYAKTKYGIQTDWSNAPSHADAGVDNSFLFVLVTTGFFGLCGYLWMWFYLLKNAIALFRKNHNSNALIFIASSFGLFVHALFMNSLFFPEFMIWLWVLYALIPLGERYST